MFATLVNQPVLGFTHASCVRTQQNLPDDGFGWPSAE